MNRNIKNVCFFGLIFLFADQIIKVFINDQMVLYQSNILIRNLLSITLVHNTGAAFSILSGSRLFLILIALIAVVLLLLYVKSNEDLDEFDIFNYSLLLGGILGNLLDRIIYGYVIDYISLNIMGYSFPIFNFADICIVTAILLMIIKTIKGDVWKS